MPYGNIIALNQNAAIFALHRFEHQSPAKRLSFLIDAGASYFGYASDITRTYAFEKNRFDELITAMNKAQLELIDMMRPGCVILIYTLVTHAKVAQMLLDFDLATGDAQGLVDQGITSAFLPHGLGHMLGLQVHDVGGFSHDERGTHIAAPEAHPFLRCTRILAPNQVLTMEPGLYIIDTLLMSLNKIVVANEINWQTVDELRPFWRYSYRR